MNPHLQPWTIQSEDFPADGFASDQLEYLLGYGILAPSPHNTQPWRFRINATDADVFLDSARRLAVVDPKARELLMSCGAVLFNLRIAAEYFEKEWRIEPFPDPKEPELVARFHLGLSAETSSEDILLFHAIPKRFTHRGPFKADPIAEDLLNLWAEASSKEGAWLMFADADATRVALANLIAEADRRQWAEKAFRQELAQWVRPHSETAEDGLPVHDLGIRDWLSFLGPSLIRTFDRGKGQAAHDQDIAEHAPLLAVLGTSKDDPLSWLRAGQALQALLLRARSEEVWTSFLCQPVEIPNLREAVADLCGRPFPQVILRMGYGDPAQPAPRRPLRSLLLAQPEAHRT